MLKLKQIESILKNKKTIITTFAGGCQWLSDGSAFYPVSGLPKLDRDNIFTIFDVPVEKRAAFNFQEVTPPAICFENTDAGEQLIGLSDAHIVFEGRTLAPQPTSQGLAFLDVKYLKPFFGVKEGFDIYERINAAGESYFAVKAGFLLLGLIMPVKVSLEKFIGITGAWHNMAALALENEHESKLQEYYQQGLIGSEGEAS